MPRLYLFLLTVLLFSNPVAGQVILEGRVTCRSTGNPLNGAHVTVSGKDHGTYSGSGGHYRLTLPSTGSYKLSFTFIGYRPVEKAIRADKPGIIKLNVILDEEVTTIGEVEIKEERINRMPVDQPVRMENISPEQISISPGQQVTQVLDNISGVTLNGTTGIYGSGQVVSMRGLSGNDQGRTLILLDGVPLNKADGGSVNWNRINRDNLGEITVIKGPPPVRYGSNAMGGVIEMNSAIPVKSIGGSISASYGTFNTLRFDGSVGGKTRPGSTGRGLFYSLNGFYTSSDGYNPEIPEYLEPGDTFFTNTHLREAMAGARLGYLFSKGQQVEIGGEFYNDRRGRGMQIYEDDGAYDEHNNYMARARYKGSAGKLRWDLSTYFNREAFRRMNEFMSDGSYNLYYVKSDRTDLGATAGCTYSPGGHHEFSAGVELRNGSVYGQDIYYTSTDLITNAGRIGLYAGWIQDEMNFAGKKIQVVAGLRFNTAVFSNGRFTIEYPSYSIEYLKDFQDTLIPSKTWSEFDPKLSIQYRFSNNSRIYLSLAKGFRAPNLDDLCRSGKRSGGFRIANPGLGPENLYNLESGADLDIFPGLRLAVSAYYSIGSKFMYAVATGDSVNMGYKIAPIEQKRNISKVTIYGGETDLEYKISGNINLTGSYSFTMSRIDRYEAPDSLSANLTGKSLVDVPIHKINASFTWNNRWISMAAQYKFYSSRWINDQNIEDPVLGYAKFPSYQMVSIKAWHTFFSRLTLFASVDNLFDEYYIDQNYRRNPGRTIIAEIIFKF